MAVDAFLFITGISGPGPGGSVEIDSFSFGVSNSTTVGTGTGGSGAGKVALSDFSITKTFDSSSPKLFDNAINGMIISSAVLKVYRGAGGAGGTGSPTEYLMITMTNVIISGYTLNDGTSGGQSPCPPSDGGRPKESISFNFEKLAIQYMPQSGT
ncbi:MAG TPA: type VI secretion system tube protein Hcp [Candidatus Acidoferrales bacterium]|nr:type VI secretion system tube protein Hcp [Candidatus Acidoferrales bacterium]